MEYSVARASSIPALIEEVNNLLREGWGCQGGILGIPMGNGYFQAMTREKPKNENTANVVAFSLHAVN